MHSQNTLAVRKWNALRVLPKSIARALKIVLLFAECAESDILEFSGSITLEYSKSALTVRKWNALRIYTKSLASAYTRMRI